MSKPLKGGLINVEAVKKVKQKKETNRKTITIQKEEFDIWEQMKGIHSWTSLLRIIREKAEQLDQLLSQQIVIGATNSFPVQRNGILPIRQNRSIPSVLPMPTRPKYHEEYKKLVEEDKLKNLLKPMSEEELDKIQKSDEELEEKMIHSAEIAIERYRKLNPPPT